MNKIYKIFMGLTIAALGLSSCETYGDVTLEYSPIFPLSGEWRVDIVNTGTNTRVTRTAIYTYDTANKTATEMWVWINTAGIGTKVKITCDPAAGTFSGSGTNTLLSGTTNVIGGKVIKDGSTTPSGGKSDSVEFTYTTTLQPGITYKVTGYRRTGWPEDE